MAYREIEGNLIDLARNGAFDIITHGCNCMSNMGSGIAVPMSRYFGCDRFPLEDVLTRGDINKLGQIDFKEVAISFERSIMVVNSYTQYVPTVKFKPLDYEALTLCMRKINHVFKGQHIGLPKIGAGLAGGDWERIREIIKTELKDCEVTVAILNK